MSKLGARAVVGRASMAGLLTAGVLSEFYRTVTVVERDVLPDAAAQRRGASVTAVGCASGGGAGQGAGDGRRWCGQHGDRGVVVGVAGVGEELA
jgi:hypothetical protein